MASPLQGLSPSEQEGFFIATSYVNSIIPIAIANCFGFGFFVGDWFSSVRLELRILSNSWRKPMGWAFVPTRLFALTAQICYLLDLKIGLTDLSCGVNNKILGATTVLAMAGAYALLTLRCLALCSTFRYYKFLEVSLAILWAFASISFITVPIQVEASKSTLGLTICNLNPIGDLECMPYFIAFAFDIIISTLLITAIISNKKSMATGSSTQSRNVRSTLLSDTTMYLLLMSSLSLACGILMAPAANVPVYLKSVLTGMHLSVETTLACRVTLNLRLVEHTNSVAKPVNKSGREYPQYDTPPTDKMGDMELRGTSPSPTIWQASPRTDGTLNGVGKPFNSPHHIGLGLRKYQSDGDEEGTVLEKSNSNSPSSTAGQLQQTDQWINSSSPSIQWIQ